MLYEYVPGYLLHGAGRPLSHRRLWPVNLLRCLSKSKAVTVIDAAAITIPEFQVHL